MVIGGVEYVLSGTGGRPYEEQARKLYDKYQTEFEKSSERYTKLIESKTEEEDLIYERQKYLLLRSMMIDLFKMMKTCGYLDEDELKTRKLKTNKLN